MRHLRSYSIVSFLILILIGQTYGAFGQTIPIASHVVINEADINPPGDDTKYPIDWVELYNPTNSPVNIGGWTISATTGLKQTLTIPANTMIQSKQFLVFTDGPLWFPHAGAVIQLKSSDGTVIDQTPPLTDFQGDSNSWQRIYDGYENTGTISDWVFKLGTPGSSNGQPPTTTTTSTTSMTLAIDKSSYIFGDTIMMSGKVSQLGTDHNTGYPLSVNLIVSGPGYQKTLTLYPNNNLQFSTSLKADPLLGFQQGSYSISASYGTATASAAFVLSSTPFIPPPPPAANTMSISTDKPFYTISDTITLLGNVSQVIPLTPVTYKVYDPTGAMIYQGNLFPDSQGKFGTYNPYQQHVTASGIFINTVSPIYGLYNVIASYGTVTTTTSFALVSQSTQTAIITMSTDKQAYAPGDTVKISGRINLQGAANVGLIPFMQIIQTFPTGSGGTSTSLANRGITPNAVSIKTYVKVASDGTFTYDLVLPGTSSSLGNYRVIVTTTTGSSEADFAVVTNPSTYQVTSSAPLSITTDKTTYALGDNIVISGLVLNPLSHSGSGGTSVNILVTDSTGRTILSQPASSKVVAGATTPVALTYYAYPDSNGQYQVTQVLQRGIFQPGNYTLKATYNSMQASVSFSVYDSLATGLQGPIAASIDKQVYGIGETVHLTGKVSVLAGASSSYTVNLIQPTGNLVSSALSINNGLFSWDYTIPTSARITSSSVSGGYRGSVVSTSTIQNLYGIYTIDIHSNNIDSKLFFQVVPNPQNQTQISPIVVETDKTDYSTTEVVNISGQVLPQTNTAAQEQNTQAQLLIYSSTGQEVYRNFQNVNTGGQFHLSVPLHPIIWPTGTYKIYTQYLSTSTQTTFNVTDLFSNINSTKLQVFMTTDRDKYLPGQTVLVTGRTSSVIAITNTYLTFGLANDTIISEGQVASQHGYTLQTASASFDQYGSFSYDYTIPHKTPVGNYTVIAQVPFGFFNAYYQVVNQLPPENITSIGNVTSQGISPPTNATQTPTEPTIIPSSIGPTEKTVPSTTLIDKQGMISDSTIPMTISQKTIGNNTYYPREIDGLLRVNPGDTNSVTIKLSSQDGTCVIGPDPSCKVSQSTTQTGSLYQIVKLGSENFLIGFSGPGQRLQQFSVIPANANDIIPDSQWNVDVIKKDQVSRFYYQVTYISK